MSPSRKSRYINQGIYLSNRDSVASCNGTEHFTTLPDTKDIEAGLKDIEAGLRYQSDSPKGSQDDLHKLEILRQCTHWYTGDHSKAAGRLGVDQSAAKRSRFSFTPAMFQLGTAALSTDQTRELARVNTDTASGPSLKDVDASTEPPDGGALAWAHAFAGHLVAFNVQWVPRKCWKCPLTNYRLQRVEYGTRDRIMNVCGADTSVVIRNFPGILPKHHAA